MANKELAMENDAEFHDKLLEFTDEGNEEKRCDYNNFLRRDNTEKI